MFSRRSERAPVAAGRDAAVPSGRGVRALLGRAAIVALGVVTFGCASPPAEPPAPASSPLECAPCAEAQSEVLRLRRELAARDVELRDLRAVQREQARALEDAAKQATRTRAQLRRRATEADAAASIAEVEVALSEAGAAGTGADASLLELARQMLAAATAAFGRGDWGAAIEAGEHAATIVVAAREGANRPRPSGREGDFVAFEKTVLLTVRVDSHLRRQPGNRGAIVGQLERGRRVFALGYWRGWMRVLAEDGRAGWVYRALLGPR